MDFSATQIRSLLPAISYAFIVGLGFSLSLPLISFALEAVGASRTIIGLHTAVGGLGTILAGPFIPRLAQRLGVERAIYLGLTVTALTLIGFAFLPAGSLWFIVRFIMGVALGILFILSEFWINAVAPENRRSLVLGIYATVLALGFAAGPLVLRLVGQTGPTPYLVGAAIVMTGIVPLIIGRGTAPALTQSSHSGSVWRLALMVPMASFAALLFGGVETAGFALAPLYGTSIGRTPIEAAQLISVIALGNLLFQVPIGLLADRMNRAHVLIGLAAVSFVGSLLVIPASRYGYWLDSLLFFWGGIVGGFYTVGLALLGQRFKGADLANANAAFVMMYSAGQMLLPFLYGAAMDAYNPHGLMLAFAVTFAAYMILPLIKR